ncbi:hypothetical protein Zmor_011991 [Zophobas morio]|uniref:Uncharacterized protein n=1 Tax=Zophobas morio TaxID=2755281 RepID=A0AA38HJB0_9CUCU|nr:hypothetical protein Zmor_011991 [Zophobas morio]
MNYRVENDYASAVINNPIANYTTYSDPRSSDTFFPDAYVKYGDNKLITSTSEMVDDAENSSDIITDIFGMNALTVKNKHFSVAAFDDLIDRFGEYANIDDTLALFFQQVVPSFFGESALESGE